MISLDELKKIIETSGYSVIDEVKVRGHNAKHGNIPDSLHEDVKEYLKNTYPKGLYSHQSYGIECVIKGEDVCLATSTASGKSLVFMASACHFLKTNPNCKILVLYPAKALIQDQMNKWTEILTKLNLMPPDYIDGAVYVQSRQKILKSCRVILMTPDVAHAWLLSNTNENVVKEFLQKLKLLILDEAHVYDGVFGTNMAYFLRRLLAVSNISQIITSTATISSPASFVQTLTGRKPVVIDHNNDGAFVPDKTILLVRGVSKNIIDKIDVLLRNISQYPNIRFLAFGDSRKIVEHIVSIFNRNQKSEPQSSQEPLSDNNEDEPPELNEPKILPYRAGYEEEDRIEIQKALCSGTLSGVVSTSALELGLDIGDINIVIMLGTPLSVKSFWQRLGRCGRKNEGFCIFIDDRGLITNKFMKLSEYLEKPLEPELFYLNNQFIQFSHALCAAIEYANCNDGHYKIGVLDTLPDGFKRFFENEINPRDPIPPELYPIKQIAQNGPHHEFPLRNAIEKNFKVIEKSGPVLNPLGNVTHTQFIREAYPGAIYYYMGKPFRVKHVSYRYGEIHVSKEKQWFTQPILQNIVFPKIPNGVINCRRSNDGFIAEIELQVSERIIGFVEKRGPTKETISYERGSPYSEKPITRFFETTGICFFVNNKEILREDIFNYIISIFCLSCGVHERDLGIGSFYAKPSLIWQDSCQGFCIYDATVGSLRITHQLYEKFQEIINLGIYLLDSPEEQFNKTKNDLYALKDFYNNTKEFRIESSPPPEDWVRIIAPGEKGILTSEAESQEVTVIDYRYTRQGLMYELQHPSQTVKKWMVKYECVKPIYGVTKEIEINLSNGEEREII